VSFFSTVSIISRHVLHTSITPGFLTINKIFLPAYVTVSFTSSLNWEVLPPTASLSVPKKKQSQIAWSGEYENKEDA
jgi:hypothetical protein